MPPDPQLIGPRLRNLFGDTRESPFHEASMPRVGLPGSADSSAIAQRLRRDPRISELEAEALAKHLVALANRGLAQLSEGLPEWRLSEQQVSAFEAVIQVRGRPALRVEAEGLEDLDKHPGSDFWATHIDLHRKRLEHANSATGAVRVKDAWGNAWGQGTAFLVAPDLVLTNRHVLIPPNHGQPLVQRVPGAFSAQLKQDFSLSIDFAFDAVRKGRFCHPVLEVPFISAIDDPVDAALLRIEPVSFTRPLQISRDSVETLDHLYVLGHPGPLLLANDRVNAVFGTLDECKRLSFGRKYPLDAFDPAELMHDASTIGGYSGGPVFGLAETVVRGLHYWGDPRIGNRAISATALQRHTRLGALLRQAERA